MSVRFFVIGLIGLLILTSPACAAAPTVIQSEGAAAGLRERMVETQLAARDIVDPEVLDAMRQVPRHLFVPESMRDYAYGDSPLPIGREQTISQPYIVALMTQMANPEPEKRALEVGTGSGYQAAVLSQVVREVFSIEIIPELARESAQRLEELGYRNVSVRQGDGYAGWPEKAPFDIIIVTAAAARVPEPLTEQLAEGGRMVIPVGRAGTIQTLMLLEKKDGKVREHVRIPVRFVPMTGRIQEN
jgi:protein-L-isoaspartate(D-aspartate) O-methyltransferase